MVKVKKVRAKIKNGLKKFKKQSFPLADIRKEIINSTNKHYGYEIIIENNSTVELQKIPIGILAIDIESDGGIPRGRGVIYVGNESTFKSSLLYATGGAFQRICGNCMRGSIKEHNYKKVHIILNKTNNDYVRYDAKEDVYYSNAYLADSKHRNFAIPDEKLFLKNSSYLYAYEIECSVCRDASYSLFGLLDAEQNYTRSWVRKFNVVAGCVIIGRPEHSEQTGDLLRSWLDTGRMSVVGVDSVDALGAHVEDENSFEDQQMGVQARVWNKITRAIHSKLNKVIDYKYTLLNGKVVETKFRPNPTIALVQQYREKIGAYGNPNVMGGGKGKGFLSSLTISLSQGEKEWETIDKKKVSLDSMKFNFDFSKSKVSAPHRLGAIYFNFKTFEVDNILSLIDYGLRYKIIKQAGAWYDYKGTRAQGKASLADTIREDKKLYNSIKAEIMIKRSE